MDLGQTIFYLNLLTVIGFC